MATRTQIVTRNMSQSNVERHESSQSKLRRVPNPKKRGSGVGTTKHSYPTRNRGVLVNITNNQNQNSKRSKQTNIKCHVVNNNVNPEQYPLPPSDHLSTVSTNLAPPKPSNDQDSVYDDLNIDDDDYQEVPMKDESDCELKLDSSPKKDNSEEEIVQIDAADIDDPQAVSEYIQDIMMYFRGIESRRAPKQGYMDSQRDINAKMREILIDWLSEVHLKFKLRLETMYLTVNLIDRFLSLRAVSRTKLQLVGCTAMLIASKYEEIYAPEVRDFVYISDKAYTRDQVLMMESIMLNTLQFNLTVPSALRFGQRFTKLVPKYGGDERFKTLVKYLMELTLQDYKFLKYLPSKIAASAIFLALSMISGGLERPTWTSVLKSQTNYDEEQLADCVRDLQALGAKEPQKYRAVRKKYSARRFREVGKIPVGIPLF